MGRSPRSWAGGRTRSLAVAAAAAATVAVVVGRRRPGPRRVRAEPAPEPHAGAAPPALPEDRVTDPRPAAVDEPPAQPTTGDPGPRPQAMAVDEPPAATHEPTTVAARLVDEPPIDPPAAVGGRRRGPRAMALAAGLLIAVGATATAMALGGEDEPREGVDAGAPAGPDATSTGPTTAGTTRVAVPADEAFTLAADRLVSAGSFAYAGTTSAIDVSPARPGLWLAVELTVEGEVSTAAGQLHEIAADGDGQAVETVTDGPSVWSRRAATRATLDDAPYIAITGDSGEEPAAKGVALLPTWLRSTVDGAEAGTDALGRRLVRGVLPAEVLGEVVDGRPASAADVVLTLDDTGDPVSVEITSVPSGPALRLTLDLARIGEPVTIDLP